MRISDHDKERFLSYVSVNPHSGCWEWTGAKKPTGYGSFKLYGRNFYTHRVSYLIYKGEIPDGMFICHSCDNRCCVNPDHLWAGTGKDNADDRNRKNRHWVQRGSGVWNARLTEDDIRIIRDRASTRIRGIQTRLAKEYGVSRNTISAIVIQRTWVHVK
jgi:hypothetical protein